MDLSPSYFAELMDRAFGQSLNPPFNPYANNINFLLVAYVLPYTALTSYEGLKSHLQSPISRRLCDGLLGVQSMQDAVIRPLLYEHATMKVEPYGVTMAEFTNRISELRNRLGRNGIKDEGNVVPPVMGAEGKLAGNLLADNSYSLCYQRAPREILRILYGKGIARVPRGYFPEGANGQIARSYLHNA
ncbi:desiccation-related protein PCC13-62 [Cinnamomum micranthum f. kanehirae]|uniref:Desiccation-related protein PCC13-62 n=1 Tax=Cinnamomum micranthum f. kanehirae TaxID=337451 RepID=A0A443N3S4_9MAGN|nr:desiccation-related protein PCC13-62 [Cinnamomum micranthum f. kanehirae]